MNIQSTKEKTMKLSHGILYINVFSLSKFFNFARRDIFNSFNICC